MDSSRGMRGVRVVRGWSQRGVRSAQLCLLRGVRVGERFPTPALSIPTASLLTLYFSLSPLSPLSIPYLSKEFFGEGFSNREGMTSLSDSCEAFS